MSRPEPCFTFRLRNLINRTVSCFDRERPALFDSAQHLTNFKGNFVRV